MRRLSGALLCLLAAIAALPAPALAQADGPAVDLRAPFANDAVLIPAPPGNRVAPAITRGFRVGDTLTSSDGAWSLAAESFTYQRLRVVIVRAHHR